MGRDEHRAQATLTSDAGEPETPGTHSLSATVYGGSSAIEAGAHTGGPLPSRDPGRYERVAEHARGGLGQIWRATDRDLGRTVALKELLRPTQIGEARFVREALITARLEHPSIVAVHDAGRAANGHPFYTMKMVAGRSLGEVIRETATTAERLALLPHAIAVADAVGYAHSHRVIHRDLKPSNVLVGEFGETVVVDWGLAKELGDADLPSDVDAAPYRVPASDALTRTGSVLGTPAYMAPEQARGEDVDERADVYALGALLYHLLAGAAPYRGSRSAGVLADVLEGPPPDLSTVALGVPADLIAIVAKAMARAPGERYRTARELAEDLRRFQTGKLVSVHAYSVGQLWRRWYGAHRTAVLVGAVALLALAVVGVVSLRRVIAARAVADQRLTDSTLDQGRRALLADDFRDGALHLSRAYSRGAGGHGLGMMLPLVMRPFEAEKATLVHPSKIWEVNYSADGGLVLVTAEGGAHLWDGRTGAYQRSFRGHTGQLRVARFSPDATLVVSGADDNTARVWRAADATEIAVLEHDAAVYDVAVSPDATQIATATTTGTVRLWARDGTLQHTIPAHEGRIWRVVYAPDGSVVASAGVDTRLALWDPKTGERVHTLAGHRGQVRNLAFNRAGDRLVSVSFDYTAKLWDVPGGALIATLKGHTSGLIGARFSPDGTRVVTSGFDPHVNLWNAADGSLVQSLRGHSGAVYWSTFTPDGRDVVTVSWDGTARVWDAATGTEQLVMAGHEGPVVWGALSPDGATLATSSWDGTVRLWDTTRRMELARLPGDSTVLQDVVVDATSERVLGCSGGGHAYVFHRDTGVVEIDTGRVPTRCALGPGGQAIATAGYDGVIRTWSAEDGHMIRELSSDATRSASAVAFHPDGETVAAGASDGAAILWNTTTGAVREFRAHDGPVLSVELSLDGAHLLTAGVDHHARVWDLGAEEPALSLEIEAHDYIVSRARFSPDGARIATSSYDGSARVWDARTGALIAALTGHAGEVFSVAFHPSGELLVTASTDVATVWHIDDERAIARFRGHGGAVLAAAFGPDGSMLATGGADGVLKLWDTHDEQRSAEEVASAVACLIARDRSDEPGAQRSQADAQCERPVHRVPEPGAE